MTTETTLPDAQNLKAQAGVIVEKLANYIAFVAEAFAPEGAETHNVTNAKAEEGDGSFFVIVYEGFDKEIRIHSDVALLTVTRGNYLYEYIRLAEETVNEPIVTLI